VTTESNAALGATMARAADGPQALVGRVIADRFRVDAVLGEGGMGAVLRCHHLGLARDVAVKVLRPELGDDAEIGARFEREARSASRLDHPNCVRVLDFGQWQPYKGATAIKYLAMQLLEGHELGDMLVRPIPPEKVVDYGLQILSALDHAHRSGVIHRDLKPENVFVTYDHEAREVLKLVDFGIAKLSESVAGSPKLTRAGLVFGTPRYMSPEQASGGNVDARTDLYSLGVIMYQMLSARLPFESDDLVTLMRMQILEDPAPLPDSVPPMMRTFVETLMAKDRNARYATAAEARAALEQVRGELSAAPLHVAPSGSLADRLVAASSVMSSSSLSSGTLGAAPVTATGTQMMSAAFAVPPRRSVGKALALGGAALALVGIIALATSSRDDDPPPTVTPEALKSGLGNLLGRTDAPAKAPAIDVGGVFGKAKAPPHALAAVDESLRRGDHSQALASADALLRQYDGDAQVHLRRARALLKSSGTKALTSYGEAIDRDPTLLDDAKVRGEVLGLVRKPELRKPAVDIVLAGFGSARNDLLLELVNVDSGVLPRPERHRVLDELRKDPSAAKLVDRPLQQALDLWQIGQAEVPCDAMHQALDAVEDEPSEYVVGTLHRVGVPPAPKGADAALQARCAELPLRLAEVRAKVDEKHPLPEAEWQVPADYQKKKKKRRGFFRRMFGG